MINPFLRSLLRRNKFLASCCSSFLFGVPSFLGYIVAKLHLNHRKASPCVFNFSFFLSSFYYQSSPWRLYMMVHQGFNSFSKCSSRFFSEEFKHSSSCISKCYSFYLIFWDGVISFLTISIHVSRFTCCQEWGILNALISCWRYLVSYFTLSLP